MPSPLCAVDMETLPHDLTRRAADMFRAIADPTRIRLLYLVAGRGEENISSRELAEALQLAPPTVTHHMKRLVEVGLVDRQSQGRLALYSVDRAHFCQLNALILSLGPGCQWGLEDGGHCVQQLQQVDSEGLLQVDQ